MAAAHAAGVFPERDVSNVVQTVLDAPVSAPDSLEGLRIRLFGREAGDGIHGFLRGVAMFASRAVDAADLADAGPVEVFVDAIGGVQMPRLDAAAVLVGLLVLAYLSLPAPCFEGGKRALRTRPRWRLSDQTDCPS